MIELLLIRSRNTEVDGTTNQITRAYDGTTLNTDVNLDKPEISNSKKTKVK